MPRDNVLSHVELYDDLFLPFELHDEEGISCLTLSKRRVQSDCNQSVQIVRLRQKHELLNMLVLYFVVVCLAP